MIRRRRSLWGGSGQWSMLLSCALSVGCASESTQTPHQAQVSVPHPGGAEVLPDAGCSVTLRVADATGCRGEWVCAEAAARSLLCAALDDGIVCSCDENNGDESAAGAASAAPVPRRSTATCTTPDEVSAVAAELCGWDVP